MRALLARIARLLKAEAQRHREIEVLLRMLERNGELAAVLNLSGCLEKHSVSWAELGKVAEDGASRPGLRELVSAFSGEESDQIYHIVPDIYGRNFRLCHDIREEPDFKEAADHVIGRGTSLLYYDRLYNLYESLRNVSRLYPAARLNVAEVGVYKGGTSFFLCELLRKLHASHARFYSIDTFEGHSAIDLPIAMEGLHSPRKFEKTSFEEVSRLLSGFPFATVIMSRIQECADLIEPDRFHFVHLDVDIYEPTLFSLKLFLPQMVPGGIVCVDDYNKKSCPGVRQAVEEVLADGERSIIRLYTQTAQCLLVKAAGVGE
jgi:Macrocin-O-methyltransferase (TylF)